MIRAVLFDFDGVLTTDPSGSFTTVAHLARASGMAEASLWDAFAPYNDALLLGRTTHAAIWAAVCGRLDRQLDIALLAAAFDATPMNEPMLGLARRLRRRRMIGIVTDNKRDRIDRLVARHALDRVFDPIVVSADCGSGKADAAIFRHALDALGVHPRETVFIDNTASNLVVPASLGMHTIHFDHLRNDVGRLAATLRERFGIVA